MHDNKDESETKCTTDTKNPPHSNRQYVKSSPFADDFFRTVLLEMSIPAAFFGIRLPKPKQPNRSAGFVLPRTTSLPHWSSFMENVRNCKEIWFDGTNSRIQLVFKSTLTGYFGDVSFLFGDNL